MVQFHARPPRKQGRLAQLVSASARHAEGHRFESYIAHMKINIIYEDENVLVVDKSSNVIVAPEGSTNQETLIDELIKQFPDLKNIGSAPRYGIVHRLDKDTSGILLIAKNNQTLFFLQNQFKERRVVKKYMALAVGDVKKEKGIIKTLMGRSPKDRRKQKVFLPLEPNSEGKREAITEFKVVKKFFDEGENKYTLLEVMPKTGRKHQIRAHLKFINHPIAGDKFYGFNKQPLPKGLERHFLHASFLKVLMPDGGEKEFQTDLPQNLIDVLNKLNESPQ